MLLFALKGTEPGPSRPSTANGPNGGARRSCLRSHLPAVLLRRQEQKLAGQPWSLTLRHYPPLFYPYRSCLRSQPPAAALRRQERNLYTRAWPNRASVFAFNFQDLPPLRVRPETSSFEGNLRAPVLLELSPNCRKTWDNKKLLYYTMVSILYTIKLLFKKNKFLLNSELVVLKRIARFFRIFENKHFFAFPISGFIFESPGWNVWHSGIYMVIRWQPG